MPFKVNHMGGTYTVTATGSGVEAVFVDGIHDASEWIESYCAELIQFNLSGEYMPDSDWLEYALAKELGVNAEKPTIDVRDIVF